MRASDAEGSDPPGVQHRVLIVPGALLGDELGDSFLDRSSFAVRTAERASEALAIAEVWRPSLVLFSSQLEDTLPGVFVDGVLEGSPDAKLLMVTDRLGEDAGAAVDAGYDAHLVTPVRAAELLSTIAELMHVRQRRAERNSFEVLVHTEGFTDDDSRGDEAGLSNSLELTEEGLLLEAGRQLTVGSSGRMLFFLPGSQRRLDVQGTVRLAIDEVRLLYRVDFVDLAPQHRTLIRNLLGSSGEQGNAS